MSTGPGTDTEDISSLDLSDDVNKLKRWPGLDWPGHVNDWTQRLLRRVNALGGSLATHLSDAAWTNSGLTFERSTTNGGTRSADEYGQLHEVYDSDGVRVSILSPTAFVIYNDSGGTAVATFDRDDDIVSFTEVALNSSESLTLSSGWANHSMAEAFAEIRLTSDGMVHLQGRVSNVSGSTKVHGSTICTLPEAYRPARNHIFTVATSTGWKSSWLKVFSNGAVVMYHCGANNGGLPNGESIMIDTSWHLDG